MDDRPSQDMVDRWIRYYCARWRPANFGGGFGVTWCGEHRALSEHHRLVYRDRVKVGPDLSSLTVVNGYLLAIDREIDGDLVPTNEEAAALVRWVAALPEQGSGTRRSPGSAFVDHLCTLFSIDWWDAWCLAHAAGRAYWG